MQRTTKIMFAHYLACNLALDVKGLRRCRIAILYGRLDYAIIKAYHIYTGNPFTIIDRRLDYPSPLFDRARKHQCKSQ